MAKWLAQGGGLNDASLWFYSKDEALTKEAQTLHGPVLAPDREHLHPDFAKQNVFSFDYLTGLHVDHPVRTPIAWTRGLQPDGTWDSDGVFGTEGGHIVFLGGNVSFYRNLKGSDGSGVLIDTNGNPTANILDVMPPGTRIVGGGPGSLNGYFKPAEGRTD